MHCINPPTYFVKRGLAGQQPCLFASHMHTFLAEHSRLRFGYKVHSWHAPSTDMRVFWLTTKIFIGGVTQPPGSATEEWRKCPPLGYQKPSFRWCCTFLPGDGKNPCQLEGVKGAAKSQNPIPSSFFRKRFYPPKNFILGPCKAHKSLLGNPSWKSSTPIFRFAQSPKPSNKTKNSTQLCCVVGWIILFSSHIKKNKMSRVYRNMIRYDPRWNKKNEKHENNSA